MGICPYQRASFIVLQEMCFKTSMIRTSTMMDKKFEYKWFVKRTESQCDLKEVAIEIRATSKTYSFVA